MIAVEEQAAAGQVDLEIETDGAVVPVKGNPVAVRRLILNLVVNARDAVAPGGGTITLSSTPGAGSLFRVTVPLLPSPHVERPEELDVRRQLRHMHLVIAGSCFTLAESLRSIFDGWVASARVATDPETLSRIASEDGPARTCLICGPPDRPAWPTLLAASRACCGPQDMIAIVPCVPGAAKAAAETKIRFL